MNRLVYIESSILSAVRPFQSARTHRSARAQTFGEGHAQKGGTIILTGADERGHPYEVVSFIKKDVGD